MIRTKQSYGDLLITVRSILYAVAFATLVLVALWRYFVG